jgi:hypothetical protein
MAPWKFMCHWSGTIVNPEGKYTIIISCDYEDYTHDIYINSLMKQIVVDKKQ